MAVKPNQSWAVSDRTVQYSKPGKAYLSRKETWTTIQTHVWLVFVPVSFPLPRADRLPVKIHHDEVEERLQPGGWSCCRGAKLKPAWGLLSTHHLSQREHRWVWLCLLRLVPSVLDQLQWLIVVLWSSEGMLMNYKLGSVFMFCEQFLQHCNVTILLCLGLQHSFNVSSPISSFFSFFCDIPQRNPKFKTACVTRVHTLIVTFSPKNRWACTFDFLLKNQICSHAVIHLLFWWFNRGNFMPLNYSNCESLNTVQDKINATSACGTTL